MTTKKNELPNAIYQIKLTLVGTRPPIWRRLLVPAQLTLAQLHDVFQIAMGWQDAHLHEFRIGNKSFGVPDPDESCMGARACIDERRAHVSEVFNTSGSNAVYLYDFGDGWQHAITLEKILTPDPGLVYPVCTKGKFQGPPEDCGGIPGFYHFLEAIGDPGHEEHAEMREWGGSFDPESFSITTVNEQLGRQFRSVRKITAKRGSSKANGAAAGADFVPASLFRESQTPTREHVGPDEKVHLELNKRECELILDHTFADDELTGRLRLVPRSGESPKYGFNLGELDELAGHVAAEANHAKNKKLQKELQHLFDRIDTLMGSYTDEPD